MGNILTLLRLEFKNNTSLSARKGKSWVKLATSLVFYAALVYLLYVLAGLLFRMFKTADMGFEALVLVYMVLFIVLLIMSISSTIKVLYYKGDNAILMRFPVRDVEIFISKTLFLVLTQLMISATVAVPFTLAYGSVTGVEPGFYATLPLVILFLTAIPFLLANLLAIPIMHITNRIRNKFALILILMSLLIMAIFGVYMALFNSVVEYLKDSSFSVFSPEVAALIKDMAVYLIPARYLANILVGEELYVAYPALIFITGALLAGAVLVIGGLYQKTLLKNIEIEGSAFQKKTKNKQRPIFITLLKKEFIQVFRSVNYSFQYFVLAAAMPVMVYYCNSLTTKVASDMIGGQVATAITFLVMLIFATVITSFAATSVTREGRNFYHTKTMPVPVRTQLFVKFVMYFMVSFIANLACVAVLTAAKLMTLGTAAWLLGVTQALAVAMTLRAMRYDVRRPRFNLVGEGEMVSSNVNSTSAVLFGFIVAVLMGILAIILAYFASESTMMLVCAGGALLVLAYAVAVYSVNLKKTYDKIS